MKVLILLSITLLSIFTESKLNKRDIIGEAYNSVIDPGTKAASYNVINHENESKLPPVSI